MTAWTARIDVTPVWKLLLIGGGLALFLMVAMIIAFTGTSLDRLRLTPLKAHP